MNINEANGTAVNVWQAKPGLADHPFEVYEPGLHHVAFNVERHEQVDALHDLVRGLGAEILDGPAEFPLGPGGYYAVYFRGPDRLKFEGVHMPLAEQRARARGGLAGSRGLCGQWARLPDARPGAPAGSPARPERRLPQILWTKAFGPRGGRRRPRLAVPRTATPRAPNRKPWEAVSMSQ